MATADEYAAWIVKNADRKGTPEFDIVAKAYQDARAPGITYTAPAPVDPTADMSTYDKTMAGFGKAFVDTGRGLGQMVGLVDRKDIEESRKLDAPLMNTTSGKVGNFAGNLALAAPTVAIPGAATIPGAAAIGAIQGLIQPSTSTRETVNNTLLGGGAGAGGVMAGRVINGLYQGGKALIEPFTQAGRDKIAGRMIDRFAQDPSTIAAATSTPTVTGALPTLAEQTGDAGLARLQDSLRAADPQIGNQIGQRLSDNNAARVAALQGLAGDSTQRAAAEAARKAASSDLYQQATRASYTVDKQLDELLSRPVVKQAMERAKTLAANEGRPFAFDVSPYRVSAGAPVAADSRQITGQGLQDLKMAMDEMLTDPASGFTGAAGKTVKDLRGKILSWMEQANPEFKAARTSYAEASKPLNAMDIGEQIARKATSNTSDLAGNQRMQANALLGLLRDEPRLIEQATGRKGLGNKLADILTPEQMNKLQSVASEADRAAAVATAGNGPGSATAQRMASQNILRQLIGPTGMPASWAESVLANTVLGKPFNLVYGGVAEPKIQQALAEAVLNPQTAQRMLQAGRGSPQLPRNALTELLMQTGRLAPSTFAASRDR